MFFPEFAMKLIISFKIFPNEFDEDGTKPAKNVTGGGQN